jgi:hypothetical protein
LIYALTLLIGGFVLVEIGSLSPSRKKMALRMLLSCVTFTGLLSPLACGGGTGANNGNRGGGSGTPAGSYTITVKASAGAIVNTTIVSLTVQP